VNIVPETLDEVRALNLLINEGVNLKSGVLFMGKEAALKKRVEKLPQYESPDANNEVYKHR